MILKVCQWVPGKSSSSNIVEKFVMFSGFSTIQVIKIDLPSHQDLKNQAYLAIDHANAMIRIFLKPDSFYQGGEQSDYRLNCILLDEGIPGKEISIYTDEPCYLCNDQGKTIERI